MTPTGTGWTTLYSQRSDRARLALVVAGVPMARGSCLAADAGSSKRFPESFLGKVASEWGLEGWWIELGMEGLSKERARDPGY